MNGSRWSISVHPYDHRARARWWFAVLTAFFTLALISWGGFVTTIDAGMAVPDWPSSFGSYDPFKTGFHDPTDPSAQWWDRTPWPSTAIGCWARWWAC